MIGFIVRRLFYIILNTIIVSILIFILSRTLTSDPVEQALSESRHSVHSVDHYNQDYNRLAHSLGYDLPLFYFSIGRRSSPDTMYKIPGYLHPYVNMLIKENGNWPIIESFLNKLDGSFQNKGHNHTIHTELYRCRSLEEIKTLTSNYNGDLKSDINQLLNNKSKIKHFIPRLSWYGSSNQFHNWAKSFYSGDFGISSIDGRSANQKIKEAIQWTLLLNFFAIVIIFTLGIWIGIWSGFTQRVKLKNFVRRLTYIFYAIPIFWLATLFIVFFSTDDYGAWSNWFPSVGFFNSCSDTNIVGCFFSNYTYMILPLICLVIPSLAYLSRQMESSTLSERKKRYALFLKSQGYPKPTIFYNYILKNALIPIITIFGQALPALISGSVVIEIIFNIPGLGRLLYESIFGNDWNVAFQLVIISALIVMFSYLIVDLLYKWVNPQIDIPS